MSENLSRRDLLSIAAGGALILGAGGALSSCGSRSTSEQPTGAVQKGGTLTVGQVGYGNSENMNLALLGSGVDILRQNLVREPLWVYRGKEFGVQNLLAESHELSGDGQTLSVQLRSGVTWHNGKPFTADDVVWNVGLWKRTPAMEAIAGLVDFNRVKKTGELSVDIGLVLPVADFPGIAAANWTSYLIPDGMEYEDSDIIGTGPFKFESFRPGNARFVANTDYWGTGPYLDEIVSDSSFTDDQARFNALRSGGIDVLPLLPFTMARQAESANDLTVLTSPSAGFLTLAFRIDQTPYSDPRVMQALKLLVDREAVVESVYAGYATVGNDLGMKGAPYYASDLVREYDPDQAESLLKAAGADSLQGSIITADFFPGATELATQFSQQATKVGLDITVNQIDTSEFYTMSGPDAYLQRTIGMSSWNPSTLSGYHLLGLYSGAPFNDTKWGGQEEDDLLFDAIAEQDPAKATEKWHAVQEGLFERGGYIIPAHQDYIGATRSNVHGLEMTPSGADFDNFRFNEAWIAG